MNKQEIEQNNKVLYLNIAQNFFDEIIAGTKTQEFREVKPSTIKKLLQLDENGLEIVDENGNSSPQQYDVIHFRVGMNKVADEAYVRIKNTYTELLVDDNGDLIEYVTDEAGHILVKDAKGKIMTEDEAYDRGFPTQEEAEEYFSGVHPLAPEFDENDHCTNGLYWVMQRVVYDLGDVLFVDQPEKSKVHNHILFND